jgi:hypothetical protein
MGMRSAPPKTIGWRELLRRLAGAALVAAPLATRVRLALRNTGLKLRQRSSCCGNPGEPGCRERAEGPRDGPGHQDDPPD